MSSNEKSGVPANDDEWKNSLHKITAELNTLLKNQQADSEANSGPGHDPVQKLQQLTEHIKEGAKNGKIDVTKVLVGAFKGLDGQHIVEDVYNMTDHANSLATSFAKAHALLVKIDGHNYKRADGTLVKYADKWNGYHDVSFNSGIQRTALTLRHHLGFQDLAHRFEEHRIGGRLLHSE